MHNSSGPHGPLFCHGNRVVVLIPTHCRSGCPSTSWLPWLRNSPSALLRTSSPNYCLETLGHYLRSDGRRIRATVFVITQHICWFQSYLPEADSRKPTPLFDLLGIKTLEEFFYLILGIQYPLQSLGALVVLSTAHPVLLVVVCL